METAHHLLDRSRQSKARKLKAEADAASGRVTRFCEIDRTCPEDHTDENAQLAALSDEVRQCVEADPLSRYRVAGGQAEVIRRCKANPSWIMGGPLTADETARLAELDAKWANGTITDDELSERSVLVRRKLRALGIEDHQ